MPDINWKGIATVLSAIGGLVGAFGSYRANMAKSQSAYDEVRVQITEMQAFERQLHDDMVAQRNYWEGWTHTQQEHVEQQSQQQQVQLNQIAPRVKLRPIPVAPPAFTAPAPPAPEPTPPDVKEAPKLAKIRDFSAL
jgi:hypothetical protein